MGRKDARRFRELGLGPKAYSRAIAALVKDLARGATRTREEIRRAVGASARGERLSFLLWRAELEGLVCNGPMRGKQQTWMSLRGGAASRSREDALGELARRYFRSHGPATVDDFVWWSGLTSRDAKDGISDAYPPLERERIDGIEYWSAASAKSPRPPAQVHLLTNWD